MTTRLDRNYPYIYEKFVLVKVTCKNPRSRYTIFSCNANGFYDQITYLNIYNKGFGHETTTVSILHPNFVNKNLIMKGYGCEDSSQWEIDEIPRDYIDKDGNFVIICLKK